MTSPELRRPTRRLDVEQPGGPDALVMVTTTVPAPGPDELVVDVQATGVNPVDCGNRAGPSWAGLTPPYTLGYELSGRVVEMGEDVEHVRLGDDVWALLPVRGTQDGGLAERVLLSAELVARRPAPLDAVAAAALPLTGCTALQTLQRLGLEPGSWLMVYGATGGVGHLLVQLARQQGVFTAATCRPGERSRLQDLGVHLLYDRDDDAAACAVADLGHKLDGVVDLVGGLLAGSLEHVRVGGHVATIVDLVGDLEPAIDRNIDIHGVLVRPGWQRLDELASAVLAGVRPQVAATYPFERAADAHRRVEAGSVGGKVVITVKTDAPRQIHDKKEKSA